jgi:hypothetical protein
MDGSFVRKAQPEDLKEIWILASGTGANLISKQKSNRNTAERFFSLS